MGKSYSYKDIISEYSDALQRIEDLTQAPEDLFLLKPAPNVWSANEIFRHLRRFNNLYLRDIDQIIRNSNRPTTDYSSFEPHLISRILIRIMEPPYKLKIPTLAPMYPKISSDMGMQEATSDLRETNQMAIDFLEDLRSDQADLNKIKGFHPIFKILPMSLTELFLVMSAHQRRHFWQAEQTLYRLSDTHY